MTNITTALTTFQGALSAFEAAKAELHKKHLAAEAACTDAVSAESAAALKSAGSASDLGMSALNGEVSLLKASVGTGSIDKNTAAAKVAELDAALKTLEEARKALDVARAALDTAEDAERTRALALRARLAAIAGETKKS